MSYRMKSLGEYIRDLHLTELDISLRSLAKELNVSASYLSDIERDNRIPSDACLRRLAHILASSIARSPGCVYDDLLIHAAKMSKERQCLIDILWTVPRIDQNVKLIDKIVKVLYGDFNQDKGDVDKDVLRDLSRI